MSGSSSTSSSNGGILTQGHEEDEESTSELSSIYRSQEKVRLNDNTIHLMKRAVKEVVWIEYKFITLEMVNLIDFKNENTVLYNLLSYLNKENDREELNARFFNTYGKHIPEVISQYRSNTIEQCKKMVVKGKLMSKLIVI